MRDELGKIDWRYLKKLLCCVQEFGLYWIHQGYSRRLLTGQWHNQIWIFKDYFSSNRKWRLDKEDPVGAQREWKPAGALRKAALEIERRQEIKGMFFKVELTGWWQIESSDENVGGIKWSCFNLGGCLESSARREGLEDSPAEWWGEWACELNGPKFKSWNYLFLPECSWASWLTSLILHIFMHTI